MADDFTFKDVQELCKLITFLQTEREEAVNDLMRAESVIRRLSSLHSNCKDCDNCISHCDTMDITDFCCPTYTILKEYYEKRTQNQGR